jgi:hypothetical protein
MIRFPITSLAVLTLAVSTPAAAEEAHRELGPHVHGHGTLNIAVESKRVSMELEVPGMDIVGFEHAASTPEQTDTVEKAKALLAKPLELFKVPAAAGCTVADAKVAIEAEHHHHDGDEADEDHDHEKAEADHDHDDHDGDAHEGHEGHNEFHVTYALDCAEPTKLSTIAFDYFKSFAGAHDLTVNVVTANSQNSFEVSRDKAILDLGGMM